LEDRSPPRSRPHRPSLYELRARFSSALLVGDREGAEQVIECLDELQLDSAVNTQFMRIRVWHHFHEYERIRGHPDLDRLRTQPLPGRVEQWITEALTGGEAQEIGKEAVVTVVLDESTVPLTGWHAWFALILSGERNAAESTLTERTKRSAAELSRADIAQFVEDIEDLYLADALLKRERDFLSQGIADFLQDFVREPEFPRAIFGNLYLALLRLWGTLHGGTSAGQEHGHVLLELASASLQLNRGPDEVLQIVERWWEARPSRSQLPFLLDAIELLEREFPKPEASANLWLGAADLILRSPGALTPSETALWRRVGQRLGIDQASIAHYLPKEPVEGELDPLVERKLKHVAIVCMRERQAREAADQIILRSRANVTIVTETVAGAETNHARTANVILFVWMASTHAIFRAFDGFDRRRFCYVQGTGAASIVRTLERWASE
jgi:predicted DNA-binding protein